MSDTPKERAESWDSAKAASAANEDVEASKVYEDAFDVAMTGAEREAFADEMAAILAETETLEELKKAAAKMAQESIDAKYTRLKEIGAMLRSGKIEKRMSVRDHNIYSLGVLRTVEEGSGMLVFERPLEREERQAALFADAAIEGARKPIAYRCSRCSARIAASLEAGSCPDGAGGTFTNHEEALPFVDDEKIVDASSFDGGAPKPAAAPKRGRKAKKS